MTKEELQKAMDIMEDMLIGHRKREEKYRALLNKVRDYQDCDMTDFIKKIDKVLKQEE